MIRLPVARAFRDAMQVTLVLQGMIMLLLSLIDDDGTLARLGLCALAGFWVGAAIIMLRRPRTPTTLDLLYVRWGYVFAVVLGAACSPLMGMLRR